MSPLLYLARKRAVQGLTMRPAARHYLVVALACNIDAKGKAVRLGIGIACALIGGVAALVWAVPAGGPAAWLVSAGLLASGAFGIFEARAGWCALRALGVKTPV